MQQSHNEEVQIMVAEISLKDKRIEAEEIGSVEMAARNEALQVEVF